MLAALALDVVIVAKGLRREGDGLPVLTVTWMVGAHGLLGDSDLVVRALLRPGRKQSWNMMFSGGRVNVALPIVWLINVIRAGAMSNWRDEDAQFPSPKVLHSWVQYAHDVHPPSRRNNFDSCGLSIQVASTTRGIPL
jgi:hypothetical protein